MNEVEQLEKEILETMPAPQSNIGMAMKDKKETRGRKPIKNDLMDKICKIQMALYHESEPTAELKKLSVAKLEEKLAQLTTNGLAKHYDLQDNEDDSSEDTLAGEPIDANTLPNVTKTGKGRIDRHMAATSLFQLNLVVAKFVELTSVNHQDITNGLTLEHWTRDLQEPDCRKQLEEVLAEIYDENSSQIEQYLTPINKYMFIMFASAANRLQINSNRIQPLHQV
jgi:formate dehydrogenase maturation protein FdhE